MVLRFFARIFNALPKITLHPLFLSYLAVLFFCGNERGAILSVGVVVLHECAHYAVAKRLGIKLTDVVMYPYGAVMYEEEDMGRDGWKVAISGPLVNLLSAGVGAIFLLGGKTEFLVEFINANLTIALFNLLPVYPLDGGRVVLALSKKPARASKILRVGGIVASIVLFGLFLLSTIRDFNPSFGILGVFLFIGAVTGYEREMSSRVARILLSRDKDYDKGLVVVKVACSHKMKTHRVLSKLSPYRVTEIEIVYPNGASKKVSEEEILRFASKARPDTPIGEIFKNQYVVAESHA